MQINVEFKETNDKFNIELDQKNSSEFGLLLDAAYKPTINYDTQPWEGPYAFTPTDERQVVPVVNLRMTQNMVINPIPSNYGKIGWDGFTMTVS